MWNRPKRIVDENIEGGDEIIGEGSKFNIKKSVVGKNIELYFSGFRLQISIHKVSIHQFSNLNNHLLPSFVNQNAFPFLQNNLKYVYTIQMIAR